MPAYATRRDIFSLGLRAEMFAARPRGIEAINIATGVFRLASHGFADGLPLLNFYVQGQATPGRPAPFLPPELDDSTVYEPSAVNGSGNLFTVAPVGGGTIASFTNAGSGVIQVLADIGPTLDAIASDESAQLDNALTAHAPPIKVDPITGDYPPILVGMIARRSALRARLVLGLADPTFNESFGAIERADATDKERLAEWIAGRGILPTPIDQTNVADDGPRFRRVPATPWIRGTL